MAEKLIPLEDAQSIVLSHVAPTDLVEIPVWQAAGLPLAEDAVADIDISPFANSAMDGYAVRSADLAQASGEAPVTLDVIGHEAAGHVFEGAIGAGETVRIMTGAPVPEGADAVVKYEIVDVLDGDGNEGSHVSFSAPAKVGENVRSAAEEAHAGDVVMHAGEVVAPAGAGLLASAGYASVKVHAAPRVGIISLGTELVAPSKVPARGQIRDSNSSALMAEALDAGHETGRSERACRLLALVAVHAEAAADQLQLFLRVHLSQQQVGALIGRQAGIHPRARIRGPERKSETQQGGGTQD